MEESKQYEVVDNVEKLEATIARVREAQKNSPSTRRSKWTQSSLLPPPPRISSASRLPKWQSPKREWAWLKTK